MNHPINQTELTLYNNNKYCKTEQDDFNLSIIKNKMWGDNESQLNDVQLPQIQKKNSSLEVYFCFCLRTGKAESQL